MWLYLKGYFRGAPKIDAPLLEAAFADPGIEHPNTYAMLDTLEAMTDTKIARLRGPTWNEALEAHSYFLPFHKARWCTYLFKIQPFEAYVSGSQVTSYIGLRADEPERRGYLGDTGTDITPAYILRQMGMTLSDIKSEARRASLPPTGPWSCACCPFKTHFLQVLMVEQQKWVAEWMAQVEEIKRARGGSDYTWVRGYTMRELIDNAQTRAAIKARWWSKNHSTDQLNLWNDLEPEETPCLMCRVK